MIPQQSNTEQTTSRRSHRMLLHDDSVRLFDARRTVFGAFITAALFLAANFWL